MTDMFINSLSQSIENGTFVRCSLVDYKGEEEALKKITARRIVVKREEKLSFTYSYKTRDIVKNYAIGEAVRMIENFLRNDFRAGNLYTTAFDIAYPSMKKSAPATTEAPPTSHDVAKKRYVTTRGKDYLYALGITDKNGDVLKTAQDKYRQIDKYIEILGGLVKDDKQVRIADMGAGKGYLTFVLYDYLSAQGIDTKVTGVEYRKDLVDLCNGIAKKSSFHGLDFIEGTIESFDATGINVMIALHACDTATDDAIAKGVKAGAELIVVAPCCHKQIRREIEARKKKNELDFLLKYGTLLERQAEMVTDAMRGLLLEHVGYAVKIFEFISDAHTPKNVMIVAQKTGKPNKSALEKFNKAKEFLGVEKHYLERTLGI